MNSTIGEIIYYFTTLKLCHYSIHFTNQFCNIYTYLNLTRSTKERKYLDFVHKTLNAKFIARDLNFSRIDIINQIRINNLAPLSKMDILNQIRINSLAALCSNLCLSFLTI